MEVPLVALVALLTAQVLYWRARAQVLYSQQTAGSGGVSDASGSGGAGGEGGAGGIGCVSAVGVAHCDGGGSGSAGGAGGSNYLALLMAALHVKAYSMHQPQGACATGAGGDANGGNPACHGAGGMGVGGGWRSWRPSLRWRRRSWRSSMP